MHIFVLSGSVYPIVMKLGKQFYIRMLANLTSILILNFGHVALKRLKTIQIFNRKRGTERHLSQLFFVICCFTSEECYFMPPFNHVHILTGTVNTEKKVTWHAKCLRNMKAETDTT